MRAARFPPLLRCAFLLLVIVASAAANTCIHTVGDPAAASAFTRLADAPVLSVDASCTQTSDTLYVMGGFGPLTPQVTLPPTNAAFAFDLNTNEWKALAAVPFAGSRTQAANNGTHIFLVGGFEGNSPGTPRTGAHVYSIAEDKWTELPSLPLATGGGGLAVVGSQLIYMSGQTGEGVYALTILVLDLTAPTAWTAFPGALYPSPRADFLALVFNTTAAEIVFTAGGDIGTERDPIDLNTTLAFTPATGAFEELAQMPVPRSHYGGAVVPVSGAANCCPARVILLGGRSQQNAAVLADIVEYSPEEDIWTTIANLPHQWYTPCAAVHTNASGSFLFVTGGGLDFFFPTNDTWVAPLAAGCNTPTVPVVPPAPPATVPVTVPPSVTGAAIGNAAAAATTTAAGPVAVAAVTGVSTATTGAGATTGAATTSAPPTSGTAPPTTGTAPPTTGTTAPTTGTTAPTTPPTTAPTTPPTTAPTTGTTPPTAAPPTTPPTPPPTSIIPVSRTLTTGVTFNRASLNAALATALAGSPFTAAGGGTTGLRTVATLNGVAFAGRPTLSPLAPTGKQANEGAPLAHYPPLLALCLVALLGAHLLVH